ncbi:MAG: hypothetical protein ACYTFY_22860 [Planctomycetota bacterium]|jgi:hypothetical protein
MKRQIQLIISACLILFCCRTVLAMPPLGDPNQPYDRLPGTYETPHIKWAKPRAEKLKMLFIIPYSYSREIIELSQRLDCDYSHIMTAGRNCWEHGMYEGATATNITGGVAEKMLEKITRERLALSKRYDAIIIGDVSWLVLPDYARELILEHVNRGTSSKFRQWL